jgi:hypothetical protein
MRHVRLVGVVFIVLIATSAALGEGALAASTGHQRSQVGLRYAKVRQVCPRPKPARATCLALALVAAPAGSTGASPYTAAGGAASTGPAGGLTPADLAGAYGYNPSAGGAEHTVAIVDAYDDPKIEQDLATFDNHYGLSACTGANGCFKKRHNRHGVHVRIRADHLLRNQRSVLVAARLRDDPGRGLRGDSGPHGENHLPLPDRRDERVRNEQGHG